MKDEKRPEGIAQQTLSRRSVLDWIGKATVLGFGGGLLASCVDGESDSSDDSDNDSDSLFDSDASTDACDVEGSESFVPGDGDNQVFDGFTEYTVDQQDLENILKTWTLRIDGMVENPVELSFAELLQLQRLDQIKDFHCVVGWSVYDVPWNGVHMNTLFDLVKPLSQATHVTFHTLRDIYNESLPIEVAREPSSMLAYGIDCSTLPLAHGFPIRLVVPRLLGYKNAKYVYRMELTDEFVEGYWVERGYPPLGEVPEDRLRPGMY